MPLRPRSPSHAAKNKTPADRVAEFGHILTRKENKLFCDPCHLTLDHTRRSTIVEHLRSRKHCRLFGATKLQAALSPPFTFMSVLKLPECVNDNWEEERNNSQADSNGSTNSGMSAGPYLLKKDAHCDTILDQLLQDDFYSDVTLTAEGKNISAHRIVLSLASDYFRKVLAKDMGTKSVVIFSDLKFRELKNVVNFIYTGEVTLESGELEQFMKTAATLGVSSLKLKEGQTVSNMLKRPISPTPNKQLTKRSKTVKPVEETAKKAPVNPADLLETETLAAEEVQMEIKTEPEFITQESQDSSYSQPNRQSSPELNQSAPPDRDNTNESITEEPQSGRCPYCPEHERSLFGERLSEHLEERHSAAPAFTCIACSLVYMRKAALLNHLKTCPSRDQSPTDK